MGLLQLRDYQTVAENNLRQKIVEGHRRIVLCSPTGSGKTEMAISIISQAAAKGSKCLFVCDRRALVTQTSTRLYNAGVSHGVIMGGSSFGRYADIRVCSIQKLARQGIPVGVDIIIIDECHTLYKSLERFLHDFKGIVIGLSATPFRHGLGDIFTAVVNAETTMNLIKNGYLSELRPYGASSAKQINFKNLKTKNGEWTDESAGAEATRIMGDVVADWIRLTNKHFGRPVKTILFAPTIAACEALCAEFQKHGYDFRPCTSKDADDKSAETIEAFRRNEFLGIVSVERLVKGFDVPDVLCIVCTRPFKKSLMSWIQMIGRGARIFEGKEYCLIIDHVGNWLGFMDDVFDFFEHGVARLLKKTDEKKKTERKERVAKNYECKGMIDGVQCGLILMPSQEVCPSCGTARPKKKANIYYVPAVMEEMEAVKPGSREWRKNKSWVWEQICKLTNEWKPPLKRQDGSNDPGVEEKARKFALAQFRNMYEEWPKKEFGMKIRGFEGYCDNRVRRAVRQNLDNFSRRERNEAIAREPVQ